MASLLLECPHCGAEKVGFLIAAEVQAVDAKGAWRRTRDLLICSNCDEGLIAVFVADSIIHSAATPISSSVDPRRFGWRLERTYPASTPSACPNHTPDELKRFFLQAKNAAKRGDPDASGAMSRKVVDVSTQMLLGEKSTSYKNIFQRIEALAAEGMLTSDLKDWAHEVRLGGADAAHDLDPFTLEEALELLDFAELYLTYVYTLPGRLKERRERSIRDKAAE